MAQSINNKKINPDHMKNGRVARWLTSKRLAEQKMHELERIWLQQQLCLKS
jgi:hypothetical protein